MDKHTIKAVVFDFDGTIADSLPLCIEAFRRAALPFLGRNLSDAEITAVFGPSEEGTALTLVPNHQKEVLELFLKYYEELHEDMGVRLFDGISQILNDLKKRGKIVGLVTGKGPRSCRISLEKLGLANTFDVVKNGWAKSVRKREDMLEILNEFSLKGEEAVYIGDVPSDVVNARAAGYTAFAALWCSMADKQSVLSKKPDAAFTSVSQFGKYLDALLG